MKLIFSMLMVALSFSTFAHTTLKTSTPKDNAMLMSSPPELSLVFTKPVRLARVTLQSKSGETVNSEEFQSKIEESAKADFFRDASFSDPKLMKTNSPRKIHIGTSMRIIKVHKVLF